MTRHNGQSFDLKPFPYAHVYFLIFILSTHVFFLSLQKICESINMPNITPSRFKAFFIISLFFIAFKATAQGLPDTSPTILDDNRLDSVDISLITCEPHQLIYALYGHTGIRIHDRISGEDVLANWGIFDQRKSFFVLRFAFGLTDYRMEIEAWKDFVERYNYYHCGIREQLLNLTNKEKRQIMQAIFTNYLPENRYYRYNYFYDNCTTRARNIIVDNIDGRISYNNNPSVRTSYREEIHQWNENHRWARWGNDFLLGIGSDRETTRTQQQFLPDTLRVDFNNAVITENDRQRKLVSKEYWVTPSQYDYDNKDSLESFFEPHIPAIGLFLMLIIVVLLEHYLTLRRIWQFDAFLLLLSGIPSFVLLMMIFSQHPTVRLNFQILVFNPLALFFGWKIIKSLRNNKRHKMMYVIAACAALGYVASFWQTFAAGVELLACTLMIRFMSSSGLKENNEKE